ncbi:hypothetical protein GUITHDRAFT_164329 [Guillardia theta CCMP2712]|uniref:Uncharacterized protein n=3 Tax=Guillardia theta TaxID=55529 RepID=L1IZ93_GUITC|nr:hypothetical protein GUITHDRAFT_164329 [Guillardia theta CCMP2712]EKX41593.1 hypothetical protein GUITHDRAFT_164329 [Guillardia theta CCMP2712]|eukprot:XP_005828573.1 hypothetical protein GUITHDRAFT_164329 [Guillardia theta CCMP2712]
MSFPGQYVALAFPQHGVRNGKQIRFRISIRSVAPRLVQLWYRLENLDGISIKQKSSQLIATGMDFLLDFSLKGIQPGIHLGGVVFSAEEGGTELFRCPVYLQVIDLRDLDENVLTKIVAASIEERTLRMKLAETAEDNSAINATHLQQALDDLGMPSLVGDVHDFMRMLAPEDGETSIDQLMRKIYRPSRQKVDSKRSIAAKQKDEIQKVVYETGLAAVITVKHSLEITELQQNYQDTLSIIQSSPTRFKNAGLMSGSVSVEPSKTFSESGTENLGRRKSIT